MGWGSTRQFKVAMAGAVSVMAVALIASACTPATGSQAAWQGDYVGLPSIPFPPARSFALDHELLDSLGCDGCGEQPPPDDSRFFYGTLALDSVDSLFAGSSVPAESWLGNLFASGWFGGLYLKTNLGMASGSPPPPMSGPDIKGMLLDAIRGGTFAGLDGAVGDLLRTARSGGAGEVRAAAIGLLVLMTIVHGYNRGYLEVVLENPPAGVDPLPPLQCGEWLGCRSESLPLESLEALQATAQRLTGSSDLVWSLLGDVLTGLDLGAVPAGRAVWSNLLGTSDFDAAGYAAIVDLSYGFLEVTEAAVLALSEALAGDVEVGRRGLVLAAGLLLWSGSYLLGLTGDADPDALPALLCD